MSATPERFPESALYPSVEQLERWADEIWSEAKSRKLEVKILNDRHFSQTLGEFNLRHVTYVEFRPEGMAPFYAYWQKTLGTPAPLLVHTPGYNAEISMFADMLIQGFNVIHINPLGYITPYGPDLSKKKNGAWPVLDDTINTLGASGYRQWFINAVMAAVWAMERAESLPGRVSFFGTSQGGMGSLVLGSLFRGRGARCVAADLPYLVNLPLAKSLGSYNIDGMIKDGVDRDSAWRAALHCDPLAHAERLDLPVLLTAGEADTLCRPETIESLYLRLKNSRCIMHIKDEPHRYTNEFLYMASAWFRMYA